MSSIQATLLAVDGMTCSSCVRHVEAALRELDGIGAVDVRVKDGRVRVEHDASRATTPQLVEALERAGYESRPLGG